jgi:hypothetical protein
MPPHSPRRISEGDFHAEPHGFIPASEVSLFPGLRHTQSGVCDFGGPAGNFTTAFHWLDERSTDAEQRRKRPLQNGYARMTAMMPLNAC